MFSINPLRRRKQIAHPAQADLISAEDFTLKADFAHPAGRNQLKRNSLCPKDKSCSFSGAGNGARTRHLRLGKAALYQMSYSRILKSTLKWCGRRDSNSYTLRHRNLNPARLPIPPRPHINNVGDPSEIRTPDPLIKSQMLYRLS